MAAKELLKEAVLKKVLFVMAVILLVFVPFHAFFTVWLHSFGLNYDVIRLWKEMLLVLLGAGSVILIFRDKGLRDSLKQDPVVRIMVASIAFTVICTLLPILFGAVTLRAGILGLIIDTRVWVFFLVVFILLKSGVRMPVPQYVIVPAVFVVGFGLMQLAFLPDDFLKHLGYGQETIPAVQYVDNNQDFPRIQSSLRGPNPLGAYLVPVVLLCVVGWYKFRTYRWQFACLTLASVLVLYGTHSRSAWLGLAAAGLVFFVLAVSKKQRFIILGALAVIILAGAGSVYVLRDNDFIQNTVFHSSEASPSGISSNAARTDALLNGAKDIYNNPLGQGVGTAGPASVHNGAKGKLSENYFIQVGQEVGIIGLGLYLALIGLIARNLYRKRQDKVALAILAALLGVCVINMLSHAWADDTLAYIMGGLLAYGLFTAKNVQKTKMSATIGTKE